MHVTLIHNPGSGDEAQPELERVVGLIRSMGHELIYRSSHEPHWDDALEQPTDLIAIAGGDGTVGRVAKRMIGRGVPLAVIAMGTANNIGHTLGVADLDLEEQILSWDLQRRTPFDVGLVKGPWGVSRFLEGAGVGLFAWVMAEAQSHPTLKKLDRADAKIDYALQMLKDGVQRCPSLKIEATLDGKDVSGSFVLFEVMNTLYIGPNLYLAPHSHPGDGLLDVVAATDEHREPLQNYLSHWQNGDLKPPELPHYRGARLVLGWTGSALHVDDELERSAGGGSVLSQAQVEVTLEPGALEFLLPPGKAESPDGSLDGHVPSVVQSAQ